MKAISSSMMMFVDDEFTECKTFSTRIPYIKATLNTYKSISSRLTKSTWGWEPTVNQVSMNRITKSTHKMVNSPDVRVYDIIIYVWYRWFQSIWNMTYRFRVLSWSQNSFFVTPPSVSFLFNSIVLMH